MLQKQINIERFINNVIDFISPPRAVKSVPHKSHSNSRDVEGYLVEALSVEGQKNKYQWDILIPVKARNSEVG